MAERTPHGEERQEDESRPTSEALRDKAATNEIYFDVESEYYVFIGEKVGRIFLLPKGCTIQVFEQLNTTDWNAKHRGKWEIVIREDLPEKLK